MAIGKLEKVDLRELWKDEQLQFSPWLEKNVDVLSEELGVELSIVGREKGVGSFSVDLEAVDADGNRVVLENQLERSDHTHLGQLLTYLTNLEAKTAIWITSEARPEHVKALHWLNEVSPDDVAFYLVQLSAYRIGNSEPAPLFTVIVGPSEEVKNVGEAKEATAKLQRLQAKFWEELLAKAEKLGVSTHAGLVPRKGQWLAASAGKAGLSFVYVIRSYDNPSVELYIETRDRDRNKRIFDELLASREQTQEAFGDTLSWERLEDRSASRVKAVIKAGRFKEDEAAWPPMQEAMTDGMSRLSKALGPHIQALVL